MQTLVVEDWLYQKMAREHHAPAVWANRTICIIGETAKAYKVVFGSAVYNVIRWIPKSQCNWIPADHEGVETKRFKSYADARDYVDYLKSCYC